MKSSYRRLGDYIRSCNEFNDGMEVKELLGINNIKYFQASHTNTIGIDLQTYRIVRTKQFAYNRATTRNGDKISIGLREGDDCIVSPSYRVFEVKDENALDSEYLMMWFRRPEFDRYARFKSHGSAHEFFELDEMREVELPIPSITKQREIVKEYNTILQRIDLNNQLIQKLEETAQAIYKQWFVDFEFPNENGEPYKSAGGEMVESKLGDIPKDWEVKSFTKIIKLTGGGTPDTTNEKYWNGSIPFFTPADVSNSYYSVDTEKHITESGYKNSSTKLYPKNTIFVTARGTVGAISIAGCEMSMNQSCYAITGTNGMSQYFVHQLSIDVISRLKNEAVGAVFDALVTKDFDGQLAIEPRKMITDKYEKIVKNLYEWILNLEKLNHSLSEMKNLLLSRIATVKD